MTERSRSSGTSNESTVFQAPRNKVYFHLRTHILLVVVVDVTVVSKRVVTNLYFGRSGGILHEWLTWRGVARNTHTTNVKERIREEKIDVPQPCPCNCTDPSLRGSLSNKRDLEIVQAPLNSGPPTRYFGFTFSSCFAPGSFSTRVFCRKNREAIVEWFPAPTRTGN